MRSIVIIISPSGETQLETKGYSGAECQQASRFLERALGHRTEERLTSEFHATQNQQQQLTQET
ncbi:MAG: DUF2997 domain-containing protein [Planctomycetaceae bacterium]|nr:DUF2997 domain-containing protein [Planctomycetaceae bacterium]